MIVSSKFLLDKSGIIFVALELFNVLISGINDAKPINSDKEVNIKDRSNKITKILSLGVNK